MAKYSSVRAAWNKSSQESGEREELKSESRSLQMIQKRPAAHQAQALQGPRVRLFQDTGRQIPVSSVGPEFPLYLIRFAPSPTKYQQFFPRDPVFSVGGKYMDRG